MKQKGIRRTVLGSHLHILFTFLHALSFIFPVLDSIMPYQVPPRFWLVTNHLHNRQSHASGALSNAPLTFHAERCDPAATCASREKCEKRMVSGNWGRTAKNVDLVGEFLHIIKFARKSPKS